MTKHSSKPAPKVVAILPAKNEGATIAKCIEAIKKSKYDPTIIVVDGYSTDDTAKKAKQASAIVVQDEKRICPGKGVAMKTGLKKALELGADIILFLDADIENLSSSWVDKLVREVDLNHFDMARGTYHRAPKDAPVTKLVARRLLDIFFPEIAHFDQPLTGEVAARSDAWRSLLKEDLPDGWGIDVAILIEAAMRHYAITEVFLGEKIHRSFREYRHDVAKLGKMSEQVAAAIIQRAKKYGRIDNVDLVPT